MDMGLLCFIASILVIISAIILLWHEELKKISYLIFLVGIFTIGIVIGDNIPDVKVNTQLDYEYGEANGYNRGFRDGLNYAKNNPDELNPFPTGSIDWNSLD